jgi:hypothetical protein
MQGTEANRRRALLECALCLCASQATASAINLMKNRLKFVATLATN